MLVQAQTYYIDSKNGSDNYTGLSEKQAWKSLQKLNQHQFKPGHKLLFKAGTEYTGQFEPNGSGSEGAPVVVGKYGKGAKPIIHGRIDNNVIVIFKKPMADIDRTILMTDNWDGPWPLGKAINARFEGSTYRGNFLNKPSDATANNSPPDLLANFQFPENYPEFLKERVLKRLKAFQKKVTQRSNPLIVINKGILFLRLIVSIFI